MLPLDLTAEGAVDRLEDALAAARPEVRVLVCAAGFGRMGSYQQVPRQQSAAMIRLNCQAAVEVTQACLPWMKAGGRILEICSTAAFQPFPYLNVYAATKAFLYRYSRALARELRPRRITVTAVCPYWVKDTEFIPTARQGSGEQAVRHFPLLPTAGGWWPAPCWTAAGAGPSPPPGLCAPFTGPPPTARRPAF